MYEFTPFKKTDKLSFESFMKFPRELLTKEEYKILSPNAMLLYSVLTDRLDLSFKQITENRRIQFYDAKGDMYVIFKRDEIQAQKNTCNKIISKYEDIKAEYIKQFENKEKANELTLFNRRDYKNSDKSINLAYFINVGIS